MGAPYSHTQSAHYRHMITCAHCRRGGHKDACEAYQAMERDFARRQRQDARDRAKTTEVPVTSMEELVEADPEHVYRLPYNDGELLDCEHVGRR